MHVYVRTKYSSNIQISVHLDWRPTYSTNCIACSGMLRIFALGAGCRKHTGASLLSSPPCGPSGTELRLTQVSSVLFSSFILQVQSRETYPLISVVNPELVLPDLAFQKVPDPVLFFKHICFFIEKFR
jgi:hypothetical protein